MDRGFWDTLCIYKESAVSVLFDNINENRNWSQGCSTTLRTTIRGLKMQHVFHEHINNCIGWQIAGIIDLKDFWTFCYTPSMTIFL